MAAAAMVLLGDMESQPQSIPPEKNVGILSFDEEDTMIETSVISNLANLSNSRSTDHSNLNGTVDVAEDVGTPERQNISLSLDPDSPSGDEDQQVSNLDDN